MLAKRIFLIILICVYAMAALFFIALILDVIHDHHEVYVFTVMTGIGCSTAMYISSQTLDRKDKKKWLGVVGIGLTAITTLVILTLLIISESGGNIWLANAFPDSMARLIGSLITITCWWIIITTGLCQEMKSHAIVARNFSFVLFGILGIVLFLSIWGVIEPNDVFSRVIGVLIILCLLSLFFTLFLTRMQATKPKPLSEDIPAIQLTCPRCLTVQSLPPGDSSCCQCKLKIKIEIEDPTCPQCGYFLRGLTRPICPECGKVLADSLIANTLSTDSQSHQPNNPV